MGNIYLQLAEGAWQATLSTIFKNLGFLIRQAPNAGKKAESHFQRGIKLSKEIGAKAIIGQAYLDLSLLYKAKGKTDLARDCITDAIQFFEQCEAETFLVRAKEALKLLK
jgi:tetratricopeptide (TPR) repeat protein